VFVEAEMSLSFISHINGSPVLSVMNNGTLRGVHPSPQKDLSSDNESGFAMARRDYVKGHQAHNTPAYISALNQKKWGCNNRDCSSVAASRRINAISNATLNSSGDPMSYTTTRDTNTARQAKHRVHSGSSGVPAKCRHNYVGAPVFYT
jgi:hypothetical protein